MRIQVNPTIKQAIMQNNIKYAYSWKSRRLHNRFTAFATDGTEYGFTIGVAPKNINTVGGAVTWLHRNAHHAEAYRLTKALHEIEDRILARNA